jgi:CheY-like chemotaxis protein
MKRAVLVGTDLMSGSKVMATGRSLGVEVCMAGSLARLEEALAAGGVGLVVVDMSLPSETACGALRRASAFGAAAAPPMTVAFYSHVQVEQREAAIAAGAGEVMARSEFAESLEQMLRRYCMRE